MLLTTSEETREAAGRAATLLDTQAQGLRQTGSQVTAEQLELFSATLRKIAAASDAVELSPEEKVQVQNAAFILEGMESGLASADFFTRAKKVHADARKLNELAIDYNTEASRER